jgi:hypothetical protein
MLLGCGNGILDLPLAAAVWQPQCSPTSSAAAAAAAAAAAHIHYSMPASAHQQKPLCAHHKNFKLQACGVRYGDFNQISKMPRAVRSASART